MRFALEKLSTLDSCVQPLLTRFSRNRRFMDRVVEFGEHPHFASLHPHKFIGVKHTAITFETVEKTTKLGVDGMIHPKGNDLIEELMLILLGKF